MTSYESALMHADRAVALALLAAKKNSFAWNTGLATYTKQANKAAVEAHEAAACAFCAAKADGEGRDQRTLPSGLTPADVQFVRASGAANRASKHAIKASEAANNKWPEVVQYDVQTAGEGTNPAEEHEAAAETHRPHAG